MCPKYAMGGKYDAKSEIFSFGMVLLEIFVGVIQNSNGQDLYEQFVEKDEPDSIADFVDKRAGAWPPECATEFVKLIEICLEPKKRRCPSMEVILNRLMTLERFYYQGITTVTEDNTGPVLTCEFCRCVVSVSKGLQCCSNSSSPHFFCSD